MELDLERHERISAPVQLVWEEIDTLEQILAKAPHAFGYDVVPGGQRATVKANLAWGPLKWALDGEASLHDVLAPLHLGYRIEVASLELAYEGTIDLTRVGDSETKLDYRGHLETRHRLASRMRGMFSEILEEHADGLVNRVKVRAEQRRLAQERLLK